MDVLNHDFSFEDCPKCLPAGARMTCKDDVCDDVVMSGDGSCTETAGEEAISPFSAGRGRLYKYHSWGQSKLPQQL